MVIAMHAPMPSSNANGLFLASLSYLTAPCIGLFFMVSGALLLPVQENTFSFLKKRLTKVLFPTLFWTLFYIAINRIFITHSYSGLLKELCSIPFSPQGNSVLWFMYVLIGLYLVSPIISKWLGQASKKELQFYLGLWGITLCYPFLKDWISINDSITGPLYYIYGYLGYFILGYYLRHYTLNYTAVIICCLISLAIPVLYTVLQWNTDFYSKFWYLSILVVILCTGWFQTLKLYGSRLIKNKKLITFITKCSNLSFGIYLIHTFIMRYMLWNCNWLASIESYIIQTICIIACTTIFSFICCWGISYIPQAQFIIGYRQKK